MSLAEHISETDLLSEAVESVKEGIISKEIIVEFALRTMRDLIFFRSLK